MNASQYRQSQERIAAAKRVLSTPEVQEILRTVEDTNPLYEDVHYGPGVTPEDRIQKLGIIQGFHLCLQVIRSLGLSKTEPTQTILPDYLNK